MRRDDELVKLDCANCGKSFVLTDFVYKARKKKNKNPDLCCSQACAAQLLVKKRQSVMEQAEKLETAEFVWEGDQYTVQGSAEAIAALKDMLGHYDDLENSLHD